MCSELHTLIESKNVAGVIDYVSSNSLSDSDLALVVSDLKEALQYRSKPWNWQCNTEERDFIGQETNDLILYLRLAVLIVSKVDENTQFALIVLISYYINPNVPWSNSEAAYEAQKISTEVSGHMDRFCEQIRPKLLKLPSTKVSSAGYARTQVKSALRPSLGLRGSAGEDDLRNKWKGENVSTLSSIMLVMLVGYDWNDFSHFWPTITTFILNVLDDPDPLFRSQGCHLLAAFVEKFPDLLAKSGLDKVFQESVEVCLTYLPKLTPAPVSLLILRSAYPVLIHLLALQLAPYTSYIDVIEKNVLALISHVLGRDNDETMEVLVFLVDQLSSIVAGHVHGAVLACFPRINFVLCLILINPYIVETEKGPMLVDAVLNAHATVLEIFLQLDDIDASRLLLLYKYDLLGAWTVLYKRVEKYQVGSKNTSNLIQKNVGSLRALALVCDDIELHSDLQAIEAIAPETHYVH